LCVLHRCDNPPCVNPAHLWLGTQADNAADRETKKRGNHARGERHGTRLHPESLARGDMHWSRIHPERVARGERHGSRMHPESCQKGETNGRAKLTESQVFEVRKRHKNGETQLRLASIFGVSKSLISCIVLRQIWKHVE
jgi:hypothetical protein